jgi:hypothetical protein
VVLCWQARRIGRWWDHRSEFLADDFAAAQGHALNAEAAQTIRQSEPVSAVPPRWKQVVTGRPVTSDHPTADERLDRVRRRGHTVLEGPA